MDVKLIHKIWLQRKWNWNATFDSYWFHVIALDYLTTGEAQSSLIITIFYAGNSLNSSRRLIKPRLINPIALKNKINRVKKICCKTIIGSNRIISILHTSLMTSIIFIGGFKLVQGVRTLHFQPNPPFFQTGLTMVICCGFWPHYSALSKSNLFPIILRPSLIWFWLH